MAPTPSPSPSLAPSQPLCIYCGIKGCQSQLCKEKLIIELQFQLGNRYIKDERSTAGGNREDGKSDQRNKSGTDVKGNGKDVNVNRSKIINKYLRSLSGASLEEAVTLYRKHILKRGNLGIRLKAYRFASEDRTVRPWSLYAAWTKWAPLGIRSTSAGGVGYVATNVAAANGAPYISMESSVSLDNIPLINPATSGGQMARVSNSIYIKRVFGKYMVRRASLYPGKSGLSAATTVATIQTAPRCTAYLQRCPLNLGNSTDTSTQAYNTGTISVAACMTYPAPMTTSSNPVYTAQGTDFIIFYNGTTAPTPNLDSTVTTWDLPASDRCDYANNMHRSPQALTEIYSLYTKHHRLDGFSNPPGSISSTVPTNVSLCEDWTYPQGTVFDVPLDHTFKGKGLHVVYGDNAVSSTSVASINQLRAKFWQDTTGTFWSQSSATSNASCDCAGYTEHLAYEFFVEFEDGRDDE